MASQKQIFLVALLLAVALGCHGGKPCHSSKECPQCLVGEAMCVEGTCGCWEANVAVDDRTTTVCRVDTDCAFSCSPGCTNFSCNQGNCICAC